MSAFTNTQLAEWAERKRVTRHLTDGRADPAKCVCSGSNCLAAQVVADYFRRLAEQETSR